MEMFDTALLSALIFLAALLYSSVGHGGASGYIAAMALMGTPGAVIKPAALLLNILVSAIGAARFHRAGLLHWRGLWPFVVASIPAAFIGGSIQLPEQYYRPLIGVVLWVAAGNLLWRRRAVDSMAGQVRVPTVPALGAGGVFGFLAGLTGVGGGIFLSPLMILLRWAGTKEVAGIAAAFILANSIAGLAGNYSSVGAVPKVALIWAAAAFAGGFAGSWLGAERLGSAGMRLVLALVLIVAGGKLVLT
jgi:uncharacterized membrane protein YfcA